MLPLQKFIEHVVGTNTGDSQDGALDARGLTSGRGGAGPRAVDFFVLFGLEATIFSQSRDETDCSRSDPTILLRCACLSAWASPQRRVV
jgi:hypothetical protein